MHAQTILQQTFRLAVQAAALETQHQFPHLSMYYAGIILDDGPQNRYRCSPKNTLPLARTGGDGVYYSLLEISDSIQPVVMTVPMNFSGSMQDCNWILGENLKEFLSLGYYNGWFSLEQLCYDQAWVLQFYSQENTEADYQSSGDLQFVKQLRAALGYQHIPLNLKRLIELKELYFSSLEFG